MEGRASPSVFLKIPLGYVAERFSAFLRRARTSPSLIKVQKTCRSFAGKHLYLHTPVLTIYYFKIGKEI